MAFFSTTWYVSSVAYAAVTARPQNTAVAAGVVRRQFTAPAVNSERCFACIVAGTTANVTDATWVLSRGSKTTDGTATWQECSGHPAVNGDVSSTPLSSSVRSLAVTLGEIIKNNSATHFFICSTAGTPGASEPTYNTTAGATTTDGTCTWTSLGPVSNFPAWGAPHARLVNAYTSTWGAAGHKFFIADNHAETQAGDMTLTSPATAAAGPTYVTCVDHTVALPPVEANFNTGATITTTGASTITLTMATTSLGSCYYQGVAFSAASGANGSIFSILGRGGNHIYKNCAFVCAGTATVGGFGLGEGAVVNPTTILWDNCWVQFGNAAQNMTLNQVNFEWRNTPSAIHGATLPTTLFIQTNVGRTTVCTCRGIDLSAIAGTLVVPFTATPYVFEDCKLNAAVTKLGATSSIGYAANPVITVRCDFGATNYKSSRDEYAGAQTTETSITRVGGATDGTTPTSDKIVTNAQSTFLTPFRMLPLAIWNETTGADVTVAVYGTVNSASLPNNDEIWMDVQYLGSSGSPIASFKSTSKSHPLAASAAVSADGSTWNGGGSGAGWSPFKLVATLTSPQPQMKGFIYINVRVGKTSGTCYIDALPALS